jgi:hypothetical protein
MPAADRQRWGDPSSYKPEWSRRANLAAALLPDRVTILEIGVGTGVFRALVNGRTVYMGADLQPLDSATMMLDVDRDPLPDMRFDYAVLLGVFEYLHQPEAAAEQLCSAADQIVASYCCRRPALGPNQMAQSRSSRGWVNNFDKTEFVELFFKYGHELASSVRLSATEEFEEFLMEFRRSDTATLSIRS